MSRDLFRAACDRAVTIFMIRYLERRARVEMLKAYALFYPDGRGDGEANRATATV
jgi:hypothetical protein